MGASLLVRTMAAIADGAAPRTPQPADGGTYASQLSKELAHVDWSRTAAELHNLVRGLNPWPVAQTTFRGRQMKLFRVSLCGKTRRAPGSVWEEGGRFFAACADGALCLEEVQYQGGKRMSGSDFLRGHPLHEDERLGEETPASGG